MNSKEVLDFLLKETPGEKGCMLCAITYKFKEYSPEEKNLVEKEREEYFLVERRNIQNGVMFLFNKRFYYDYDFIWKDDNENHWEIIYKRNVN